jgi:hypothetical protein
LLEVLGVRVKGDWFFWGFTLVAIAFFNAIACYEYFVRGIHKKLTSIAQGEVEAMISVF